MDDFDDQIFERAAQLVERGWCQGVSARDAAGNPVRWDGSDAASFCLLAAVCRALWDAGWWCVDTQSGAITLLMKKLGGASPQKWNDDPDRRSAVEIATVLRSKVEVVK